MKDLMVSLLRDEEGQGMVEYGIILGLIAIICITAVKNLGLKVNTTFETIDGKIPEVKDTVK
jgi:pilus assembly protein Flp/PilA